MTGRHLADCEENEKVKVLTVKIFTVDTATFRAWFFSCEYIFFNLVSFLRFSNFYSHLQSKFTQEPMLKWREGFYTQRLKLHAHGFIFMVAYRYTFWVIAFNDKIIH